MKAHVKEFTTVYHPGTSLVKWVKVVLQVLPGPGQSAKAICKQLSRHMEKPVPRFMVLQNQASWRRRRAAR